jgi:hypothetical protein
MSRMFLQFAYLNKWAFRSLRDRKRIELKTKTWDKTIVDRSAELREWVNFCYKISGRAHLRLRQESLTRGTGRRRCGCFRTFMVSVPNRRQRQSGWRI